MVCMINRVRFFLGSAKPTSMSRVEPAVSLLKESSPAHGPWLLQAPKNVFSDHDDDSHACSYSPLMPGNVGTVHTDTACVAPWRLVLARSSSSAKNAKDDEQLGPGACAHARVSTTRARTVWQLKWVHHVCASKRALVQYMVSVLRDYTRCTYRTYMCSCAPSVTTTLAAG